MQKLLSRQQPNSEITSGITLCQGTSKNTKSLATCNPGRNLEFNQGASDNSPTHRKIHGGIFLVYQLMLADGTTCFMAFQWTTHPMIHALWPACTTPGFIIGLRFKSSLDSSGGECAYLQTFLPRLGQSSLCHVDVLALSLFRCVRCKTVPDHPFQYFSKI